MEEVKMPGFMALIAVLGLGALSYLVIEESPEVKERRLRRISQKKPKL